METTEVRTTSQPVRFIRDAYNERAVATAAAIGRAQRRYNPDACADCGQVHPDPSPF